MPPNRHNTSTSYLHRPENKSRLSEARQARSPQPFSVPSRSIFLVNFDVSHRERLALVLRHLRYEVFIPEEHGILLRDMSDKGVRQADFLLFDLTELHHDKVWLPLRHACRLRKADGMPLMVHCFSRIYRGSGFHLMVEKLGARMDYYAERA